MEQQNQQPIQEKTGNKPPIKTHWKYVAIVAVFALLSVGGVFLLQSVEEPGTQAPQQNKTFLPVVPGHRSCITDSDCIIVSTRCSACECGASVNKQYAQYYRDEYTKLCSAYRGKICEFYCPTPFSRCLNNQCVLTAEQPREIIDISTWQTYRNEEFGFEVKYPEKSVGKELSKSEYYLRRVLFEDQSNSSKNIFIDVVMSPDSPEPIDHLGIVVEREKSSLVGHTTDRINSERAIEKDGYEGVELDYVISSGTEEISFTTILIERGDYIYKVISPTELVDEILSTFRFIE